MPTGFKSATWPPGSPVKDEMVHKLESMSYGSKQVFLSDRTALPIPKCPGTTMVNSWALKGFPYPCFRAYLCTIWILGPSGYDSPHSQQSSGMLRQSWGLGCTLPIPRSGTNSSNRGKPFSRALCYKPLSRTSV